GKPLSNVVARCKEEHLVIRARWGEPPPPGQPNRAVLLHARFNFLTRHDLPTVSIFADRATYSGRSFGWTLEGGRMMCLTDLDPNAMALRRSSDAAQFMSTAELNGLLKLPRIPDPAGVRRTRHARFADFFNNIIMLLVAVPFILSRERNIKASALMALVSVAVVYVCIYVFRHLQIPPILAAWAPILIFGPVSAVTVDAVKT
ncbi:MAG: LptF/LptG family permease, partial [Planctomycetota bacterium]